MANLKKVYAQIYELIDKNNKGTLEDIVELIDTPGFKVDSQIPNIPGMTLLMAAVINGRPDVVEELLESGAYVHNPYSNLHNPYGIYPDYPFMANFFDDDDDDDDDKDDKINIETIQHFLDYGFDINTVNKEGKTLLYLACDYERKEMVNFLLSKGAMFDQETIDVAKARRNTDIVNILNSRRQVLRGAMLHKEVTGTDIDPGLVADLHEYMGTKGKDFGGK